MYAIWMLSKNTLFSQGCVLEVVPSVGAVDRMYIPRTEEEVRSLWLSRPSSCANLWSHPLDDVLQQGPGSPPHNMLDYMRLCEARCIHQLSFIYYQVCASNFSSPPLSQALRMLTKGIEEEESASSRETDCLTTGRSIIFLRALLQNT